jgi:hypothetical protein
MWFLVLQQEDREEDTAEKVSKSGRTGEESLARFKRIGIGYFLKGSKRWPLFERKRWPEKRVKIIET